VTIRELAALSLLALVAVPAFAAKQTDKPRIEPLEVHREGRQVVVSFTVQEALSEDTLDRIRSGLPVAHRHRVEVLGRRSVPLWPAKEHGRLRIDTSAIYDSLTRQFELTRTIRTRPRKKSAESVSEQRQTTDSIDEVRRWMTEFDGLPSIDVPPSANVGRLKVRVESTLGRRFVMYLFPARLTVSAERRLEP
jgi:hypothetical protein